MKVIFTPTEFKEFKEAMENIRKVDNDNSIATTFKKYNLNLSNLKVKKVGEMYEMLFDEPTVVGKFQHFNTSGGYDTLHSSCKAILKLPDFITRKYTKHFQSEKK